MVDSKISADTEISWVLIIDFFKPNLFFIVGTKIEVVATSKLVKPPSSAKDDESTLNVWKKNQIRNVQ